MVGGDPGNRKIVGRSGKHLLKLRSMAGSMTT
jgi:hypothetical protein